MLIRTSTLTDHLSDAQHALLGGEVPRGVAELVRQLRELRTTSSPEGWRGHIERCRQHPVAELLFQDPLTRRCFDKPRGYAGDAVMLDLVYGLRPIPENTTALGEELFAANYQAPTCESVRTRRRMVGELIDRLAREKGELSALSVACGHIREALCSVAVQDGRVRRFLGVDQDPLSLAVVERELGPIGVKPVEGTVKQILQRKLVPGSFDFVYAVGLYDYLPQPVATALTARLFTMVEPGGTLLIPNLTPDSRDVGYMEAFMDWHMIYRDEAALEDVASGIDPIDILEKRIYREPDGNVVFLELVRE